jgi:hypothetical protein
MSRRRAMQAHCHVPRRRNVGVEMGPVTAAVDALDQAADLAGREVRVRRQARKCCYACQAVHTAAVELACARRGASVKDRPVVGVDVTEVGRCWRHGSCHLGRATHRRQQSEGQSHDRSDDEDAERPTMAGGWLTVVRCMTLLRAGVGH